MRALPTANEFAAEFAADEDGSRRRLVKDVHFLVRRSIKCPWSTVGMRRKGG